MRPEPLVMTTKLTMMRIAKTIDADDEVAAHHEIAEGLDDVAGGVGALVPVCQDQARRGEVEREPHHGRDQQTANTRGNLALVYGLAGRSEVSATLAVDLSRSQIQNNIAYYRSLREMLRQGRPIGNLDAPGQKPASKPRGNAVGTAPAAPAAEAPKLAAAAPATAPAPGAPRGAAIESLVFWSRRLCRRRRARRPRRRPRR